MLTVLEKSWIQGTYVTIMKAICSKPIFNNKQNGEKLPTISLKSRTIEDFSQTPCLFNMLLEVLHRAIRDREEIKVVQIGNELSLFPHDMILYRHIPQNSTTAGFSGVLV